MPYYTYIVTNKTRTVLYAGMTNDLVRRLEEHSSKTVEGFTKRYKADRVIWYELFNTPSEAIAAEKTIKGWTRQKKIDLIKSMNPQFKTLY